MGNNKAADPAAESAGNNNQDDNDASSSSSQQHSVGSLIKICDLVSRTELNNTYGLIKKFHSELGRYEVLPADRRHGCNQRKPVAIKPENITTVSIVTPSDEKAFRKDRVHQCVAFWPIVKRATDNTDGKKTSAAATDIAVQGFDDWPDDWAKERKYLINKWGWKDPQLLSGIENEGSAKADFQMYFDAADGTSTINEIANAISCNLPDYEHHKCSNIAREINKIRGVCILMYSPTAMTFGCSGFPGQEGQEYTESDPIMSGNSDRIFSLEQLRDVLHFQRTSHGRRQYQDHDNPMHRMYGGMM
jgi:hypothetical protein